MSADTENPKSSEDGEVSAMHAESASNGAKIPPAQLPVSLYGPQDSAANPGSPVPMELEEDKKEVNAGSEEKKDTQVEQQKLKLGVITSSAGINKPLPVSSPHGIDLHKALVNTVRKLVPQSACKNEMPIRLCQALSR